MKVIVEIIMGSFIDAEVSEDATVKELKEKIAVEVKLPAKRLIIVVGDEETRRIMMEYENEMLLRDLGVKEYPHVYLFFKNPDLVSREERFREEGDDDDDPMEERSSEAESRRINEELEEEEKVKLGDEKEDMKDEEEDDGDEKLNNGDEAKNDDDVEEEATEDEEGDNKEENLSRVS